MALKPEDIAGGYLGAKYGEGLFVVVELVVVLILAIVRLPRPVLLTGLGLWILVSLGVPQDLMKAGESFIDSFESEQQIEPAEPQP